MSLISLPAGFCLNSFSLRMQTTQRSFASPFGGSEQVIDMMNDRWVVSMSLPNRKFADAARIEAFINSLRGMTNTVLLHHFARPVPIGTMRGSPIARGAPTGGAAILIDGAANATLSAGDMIGVNGLLFQVAADCGADGAGFIAVPLTNRIRSGFPDGTPVTWDRPAAPFRLVSPGTVQYVPGYVSEVSIDFVEAVG